MKGSVDLAESELSDLFDRYPDINFDLAEDFAPASGISEHFSSPCSNITDHDDTSISKNSVSTAHTTPLRPSPSCAAPPDFPTLALFLENVDSADLPLACNERFEGLARGMAMLGSLLVPENGGYYEGFVDSNKPKILCQIQSMLVQLEQANYKVAEEIDNIDFVKTRAPFTVEPAMQDLWCNYRQRAKLITQYIALPCRTEKDLLEGLTHVFDAYVYHPFLELLSLGEVDVNIEDAINVLYDVLMKLFHNYNLWVEGMKDIKENQMQPLMRKIRKSPEILREIAEAEYLKDMATASIGSPEAPGMQPADERLIQELNLSTSRRRPPIPRRLRSRYRREHTV